MSQRKTVLVTGGTGLLARGMEETALPGYRIIGVHLRSYSVARGKFRHVVLDVRDKRKVDRLFEKYEFEAVIHAAGFASVDYAESHYAESLESNVTGTLNVTSACRRAGCHLIYVSTNAVFDGVAAPYRESDPVRPINKYGHIKVECERLIHETLERFTIVRPILMYGWNHPAGRPNPATWLLDKLRQREVVHMVGDVYENPLYNLQCGEALWQVVERKPAGIIHVAGGEAVNRYEFALKLAAAFGLDGTQIKRVDSSFFPTIAPRPRNTSFLTERMEHELGIKPLTLGQGLQLMMDREAPTK